jgi:hypothetical protein
MVLAGKLHIVHMDGRALAAACGERYVDLFEGVGLYSPFFGARFGLRGDGFEVSGRLRRDHCPWLGRLYRLLMWLWLLGRLEGPQCT